MMASPMADRRAAHPSSPALRLGQHLARSTTQRACDPVQRANSRTAFAALDVSDLIARQLGLEAQFLLGQVLIQSNLPNHVAEPLIDRPHAAMLESRRGRLYTIYWAACVDRPLRC
jgi:hypothetical protein